MMQQAVPKLLGWVKQKIADRVEELLDTVGLSAATYGDRFPPTNSPAVSVSVPASLGPP